MKIPSQVVDADVTFNIVCFDSSVPWSVDPLFAFWGYDLGVKVRNQDKTGIALNFIELSGTVNVTYKGSPPPIVTIAFRTESDWLGTTDLKSPSANTPWSFVIPAFTSDTKIDVNVIIKDNNGDDLQALWGFEERTIKDKNVSGIALDVGNITD